MRLASEIISRSYRALAGMAVLLALSACSLTGVPPAQTGHIQGYVVEYNAGSPVAGATVKVYKAGTQQLLATLTSDTQGAFRITLPEGQYDLVASQTGYAGSQILNAQVVAGKTLPLTIIERKAFNPNWPTTPPDVVLEGVNDGDRFDANQGVILYRVRSNPASPLATNIIYSALGKVPGSGFLTGTRAYFSQVNDTGDAYLRIQDYAVAGDTTFVVVVYDTNGNRTELRRHIAITTTGQTPAPEAPQLRSILAVTLGKPVQFFRLTPNGAPVEGNLWVQLTWSPVSSFGQVPENVPHGYRIYRSFDGKNYTAIAAVPADTLTYLDHDPALNVGQRVYYRVAAFTGNRESRLSKALTTVPLAPFSVHLTAPADNAQGVSPRPTFAWTASQTVSPYHYYVGAIWDTLTGENAFFINNPDPALQNATTWTWNEDGSFTGSPWAELQKGRSYEWQIIEAYALDDPVHPTAVSVAADGLGTWFPYGVPSTDHFTFTTAP